MKTSNLLILLALGGAAIYLVSQRKRNRVSGGGGRRKRKRAPTLYALPNRGAGVDLNAVKAISRDDPNDPNVYVENPYSVFL